MAMTKDDIIRMALEAKIPITPEMKPEDALAIAFALGKAEEREAIAEMVSNCDPRATPKGIAAAIRTRGQS